MQHNKSLASAFYRAFNENATDAFNDLLAPGWVNHPADPGRPNTPAGFKAAVQDTHAAFDDFHINVDSVVSEGDLVVCRITMRGRHIGSFAGRQASHRAVTFTGMDMHRIAGGHIAETWHFENFDGLDESVR